jgi:hypothetical protein
MVHSREKYDPNVGRWYILEESMILMLTDGTSLKKVLDPNIQKANGTPLRKYLILILVNGTLQRKVWS